MDKLFLFLAIIFCVATSAAFASFTCIRHPTLCPIILGAAPNDE